MYQLKTLLKKLIPQGLLSSYHYALALLGAVLYGRPSEKLIVIGITGTSGKSTTVSMLAHILESSGRPTGFAGTIGFKIGQNFTLNNKKMTMLGRFETQRLLREMMGAGAEYAIIETTSEGIKQYRHCGIHYDTVVLTNLYPEHIEAHGGFQNYKNAKRELFVSLSRSKPKTINDRVIPRTAIVNSDIKEAQEFLSPLVDRKIVFGLNDCLIADVERIKARILDMKSEGGSFVVQGQTLQIPLLGAHNIKNALAAATIAWSLGLSWEEIRHGLMTLPSVPGRLEKIEAGQPFTVIVDYAFEPGAMTQLYETVREIHPRQIIHVLGGTGGGRDKARRPILGQMAAQQTDQVIVTNEDPYDEDPRAIMEAVAGGAEAAGKKRGVDLQVIEDRRAAIAQALALATDGDLVLVTGKGSEQAIVGSHGTRTRWDDRVVIREELAKLGFHNLNS